MIIYRENWKGSIDMPSEIVSSFSKVSGYKAKWKHLLLLYQKRKEKVNLIMQRLNHQNSKYLKINLLRYTSF